MQTMVETFAEEEFGEQFTQLSGKKRREFLEGLTLVLHAHRYNKTEGFLTGLDINLVRDPMYKHSAKSVNRFFSLPILCFLFCHFVAKGTQNRFL